MVEFGMDEFGQLLQILLALLPFLYYGFAVYLFRRLVLALEDYAEHCERRERER